MKIDSKILEEREAMLALEGLAPLDFDGGFSSQVKSRTTNITNLSKFIEEVEFNYGITIDIDRENIELRARDKEGREIGVIRPRSYSHGQIQIEDHLEKYLEDSYRGKGLGQSMYDIWKKLNFPIPKSEISREPANILFLLKNGYYLASRFDDSGLERELTPSEIFDLTSSLRDLSINGNLDLDYSYLLVLS